MKIRAGATRIPKVGQEVFVAIRSEGFALTRAQGSSSIACTVNADAFLGNIMEYLISAGERRLRVSMPLTSDTFPSERGLIFQYQCAKLCGH